MAIVNLTPHAVNLISDNTTVFPPSGTIARVDQAVNPLPDVDGMPTCEVVPTGGNLPPSQAGTWYIVSRLVFDQCPDRYDLLVPQDLVRDEQGVILGCRSFSRRRQPEPSTNWIPVGPAKRPLSLLDIPCLPNEEPHF